MEALFQSINEVFRFIGPASDWLWDFPTNYSWYNSIPILGNFSLAVLLLLGGGLYFTVRTGFIQITHFKTGVREIVKRRNQNAGGLSALGAFCMSTAMRVGPGNIIGVTGAITTGGPGALLWMWVSAFFGMATSYMESVLAQLFKEKRGDAYVGGLPFYGKRLLKNSAIVGAGLSLLYVLYALCCLPAQSFNTITAIGSMAQIVTGNTYAPNSALYYAAAAVIVILTCVLAFSGIKKTAKFNTRIVPAMAVLYCAAVLALIVLNLNRVPLFFSEVFSGAFTPKAIFGGAFGTVLCQGVKRGLMSNEAGQGTITMAAATADVEHPAIQGCVESVGVFLDTIVICTLTGFVVVMGGLYNGANAEAFMAMDRLPRFLA
ncbi:MAG: amino acid carrier protein, partial [Eubacteriales bacterium]|nr:amino acid carrier protein [Eubacteriales bacterium]